LHRELAEASASAGKHVFLEKPMALNLDECDAIIRATELNKVHLQLGFMRRFDPEFVAAVQRIEAGEIGKPLLIKSLTHGPGLPPPWARDLASSNGMLAEVNSHDWDCVRWLMGSNPERVYAEVANLKGRDRGIDTADFYDHALVTIRFQNGGLGSICGVCPCEYGYDARVEVIGEKGIMWIGGPQSQAVLVCTKRDQGIVAPTYKTWPERFKWAYINEMRAFVACIQTQESPRVGGEDGRWAVAGVLAATKSFKEQRAVALQEILQREV
jgi:myo-inositol 2-dehydrogenase/D-chiro-inositol 1-dehydrogenase/scyllo-inositol 2-dehydrogenase (NAD+)